MKANESQIIVATVTIMGTIIVASFGLPLMQKTFDNQLPFVLYLNPSSSNPQNDQEAGFAFSIVEWTAEAYDREHDLIYYDFFLEGPSTGGKLLDMTGWTSENTWEWIPSDLDAGQNIILVKVKDIGHFGQNLSHQKNAKYTIKIAVDIVSRNTICQKLNNQSLYNSAIVCYNKSIQINPNNKEAYLQRGDAFLNLGKYNESIRDFKKAIEIDPYFRGAWGKMGIALGSMGQYNESILCFNKAIDINKNDTTSWFNKGRSLRLWDKFDEAIDCQNKVIDLDKNCKELDINYKGAKEERCIALREKEQRMKQIHNDIEAIDARETANKLGCIL
jgi:tetratricopeptide (TPR) repeat protein